LNNIIIDTDIYDNEKPFTSEIAKRIYDDYGKEILDNILMQRLKKI